MDNRDISNFQKSSSKSGKTCCDFIFLSIDTPPNLACGGSSNGWDGCRTPWGGEATAAGPSGTSRIKNRNRFVLRPRVYHHNNFKNATASGILILCSQTPLLNSCVKKIVLTSLQLMIHLHMFSFYWWWSLKKHSHYSLLLTVDKYGASKDMKCKRSKFPWRLKQRRGERTMLAHREQTWVMLLTQKCGFLGCGSTEMQLVDPAQCCPILDSQGTSGDGFPGRVTRTWDPEL